MMPAVAPRPFTHRMEAPARHNRHRTARFPGKREADTHEPDTKCTGKAVRKCYFINKIQYNQNKK